MEAFKDKNKYIEKQSEVVNEKLDRLNAFLSNDEFQIMDGKTHQILVIEHNFEEVSAIREILNNASIKYEMTVIDNGQDAISFLESEGKWAQMPVPDLIIVDLNLPKISGSQVLKYLRKNKHLSWIPRLVLTSDEKQVEQVLNIKKQPSKIIQKPVLKKELVAALISINPLMFAGLSIT